MELGEVSRALATRGVEVIAPIASHGSITFVFEAEAAGNYLLKIRHVGEGLTLKATGPVGSASIDPGPAGPFSIIALPLKAAEYEIKASAVGDQPVFVDWELLLAPGVGQSAAIGPSLQIPSVALPRPIAPSPSIPLSTSTTSASWGAAVSTSMIAVIGGPIGWARPIEAITPVGPTSSGGSPTLACASDGRPAETLMPPDPAAAEDDATISGDPTTSPTPLLTLGVLGNARLDLDALGDLAWLDHLADLRDVATVGPKSTPIEPGDRPGVGDLVYEDSDGETNLAASPGLIVTGVFLASALRRWRPGSWSPTKWRKSPTRSEIMPQSMA